MYGYNNQDFIWVILIILVLLFAFGGFGTTNNNCCNPNPCC